MALKLLFSKRRATAWFEEETAAGTFIAAGTFDRIGAVSIDLSVNQSSSELFETGLAARSAYMSHSPNYAGTIRMPWILGNNEGILAAAMRDTVFPAEFSEALTIETALAQSHADGSTGANVIGLASTTFFANLEAAGSYSNLADVPLRFLSYTTTTINSGIRGPVIVKPGSPLASGSDTKLEIDQRCEQGSTFFQAIPSIATTGEAGTIDAGSYMRVGTRLVAPSGTGSYSIAFKSDGLATEQYFALAGVVFGGFTVAISGKGFLELQIPFVASGYTDLTTSDPVSGSYVDAIAFQEPFEMATGLTQAWISDDANAYDLTAGGVEFTEISFPSAPELVQTSMGNDGVDGIDQPPFTSAVGFTYMVRDETLAANLQALSNADDATASFYFEWTNRASQVISMWCPQMSIAKSVVQGIGVDGGPCMGQIVGAGQLNHRSGGLMTLSKFT